MARTRIVIVGGGFAGFHCARRLSRTLGDTADVTLINSTDYFLYLPLLPQVTGGVLDPRRVAIPLAKSLPKVTFVLGTVDEVDVARRCVGYENPEGGRGRIDYDRLVLTVGSVNKLLPIPGIADHAHGYRGIPEALYLRDHMIRQVELADVADDADERAARLTFVVVGAGYTGTEVLAQGRELVAALMKNRPRLSRTDARWIMLDTADRLLPGLDERLSRTADRVLRRRHVDVRMKTSVAEADADGVHLSDGSFVATRTLVWCVGVRADPLIDSLGLETDGGRLVVDEYLSVPGHPEIVACGDVAAVPDVTRPGSVTAMTAQHAQRQGVTAARNIAAALGRDRRRPYRHHDLGFTVDLAAGAAAANPLHIPLSGIVATAVTAGYHLMALPANRLRVTADWLLAPGARRQSVRLGLVRGSAVPLDTDSPETPRQ
jgi:NADH:ubiquinone reductase (H+-translocating)